MTVEDLLLKDLVGCYRLIAFGDSRTCIRIVLLTFADGGVLIG